MHLELDLNEHLRVVLEKVIQEDEETQKGKKQTELLMELVDKKAHKSASLAKKVIRWPIGQTLPSQMTYSSADEHILVIGPTSEAVIPFPKAKIESLTATAIAKAGTSSKTKTFSSFAVNPVETFDVRTVIKSIQSVIENPEKEKRWKQLTAKLAEYSNGETSGALSAVEQSQLVEAIRKYADDVDSDAEAVEELLRAVATSRILTFRNEDVFLRFCVEKDKKSVVEIVLQDSSRVVSEFILAELLKLAAGKQAEERREQVVKVLARNFSKRAMTEATAEVLTASESIEIMTVLTDIYKELGGLSEVDLSGKALALITVLMDSHGSRIGHDNKLHQKFAAVSNFIIEMQSLVGTFARLEAAIEESSDHLSSKNVVIRLHPVAHPIQW